MVNSTTFDPSSLMNLTASANSPDLRPRDPLLPWISDSNLMVLGPIVVYWVLSLIFHYIDTHNLLERYRLHTPAELLKRNHVTMYEVVRDVIVQQIIQSLVGWMLSWSEGADMTGNEEGEILVLMGKVMKVENFVLAGLGLLGIDGWGLVNKMATVVPEGMDVRLIFTEALYWYVIPTAQIWLAIFFLDTWQYFLHRMMHTVPFLYRTFHSRHHRLYVPYAFGALYNHPFEGLLMDTAGAGLAFKVAGLSQRQGTFFFCFSTLKTVDDHCGYKLPWDPLQLLFANNAAYHDIHHQGWGIKTNFSQPFFICWDRWLNTMWTGPIDARYARSRARAASLVAADDAEYKSNPARSFSVGPTDSRPTREVAKKAFPEDKYTDDESVTSPSPVMSPAKSLVGKGVNGTTASQVASTAISQNGIAMGKTLNGVTVRLIPDPLAE